jgi:hypothetical protein
MPALRDVDANVLEVVVARAVPADQVVAVGNLQRRRSLDGSGQLLDGGGATRLPLERQTFDGNLRGFDSRRHHLRISSSSVSSVSIVVRSGDACAFRFAAYVCREVGERRCATVGACARRPGSTMESVGV